MTLKIRNIYEKLVGNWNGRSQCADEKPNLLGKTAWAVVAHQRCGTNFLESMLRNAPAVHHYHEILYPDFFEGGFYSYYSEVIKNDPRFLLVTDFTLVEDVFRTFFERQVARVDQNFVGFDIKIDQLNCYPRLYHCLKCWGFKVIHLCRENRLRRVISHLMLREKLRYCCDDIHRTPSKLTRMRVDCIDVVRQIRQDMEGDALIEYRLGKQNRNYLRISYEDLLRDRRKTLSRVTNFLGLKVDVSTLEPDTVKQNTWPLEQIIMNIDELRSTLARNELHFDFD